MCNNQASWRAGLTSLSLSIDLSLQIRVILWLKKDDMLPFLTRYLIFAAKPCKRLHFWRQFPHLISLQMEAKCNFTKFICAIGKKTSCFCHLCRYNFLPPPDMKLMLYSIYTHFVPRLLLFLLILNSVNSFSLLPNRVSRRLASSF
jgi:hypothetical protein